jgi:hypothetical protein
MLFKEDDDYCIVQLQCLQLPCYRIFFNILLSLLSVLGFSLKIYD